MSILKFRADDLLDRNLHCLGNAIAVKSNYRSNTVDVALSFPAIFVVRT
jgi:hypothetical protein